MAKHVLTKPVMGQAPGGRGQLITGIDDGEVFIDLGAITASYVRFTPQQAMALSVALATHALQLGARPMPVPVNARVPLIKLGKLG